MAAFLMHTKDNPMKALGVLAGVMVVMVVITIFISTAMFWRNKRSNKIMPVRRIIKKRQNYQPKAIRMEWLKFKRSSSAAEKFTVQEDAKSLHNENSNNNFQIPSPPPPPTAPALPPAPAFETSVPEWRVPTVSGSLSPKAIKKQKGCTTCTSQTALVSELKQRFEMRNAIGHRQV